MVISLDHQPKLSNALYYQCMHELQHELPHYSYEQIKTHSIPNAETEEFAALLEETKQSAQLQQEKNWIVHPLRNLYVQRYIACRLMGFKQKFNGVDTDQMCPFCWFTPLHCYCSKLDFYYPTLSYETTDTTKKHIFAKENATAPTLKFNLIVYMFEHEFRRTSNTGKLLLSCIPNTRLLISGYETHEKFLKNLFETEPQNTVILFPSEDSITFEELLQKRKTELQDQVDKQDKKWNIIVMDGTWRNARTLMRNVPETIQCIKVIPPKGYIAIFNEIRRMPQEGRVSTLEAVSWLLRDLGESDALCHSLETNLKKLVNHIRLTNCQPLVEEWIDFEEEEENTKKPKGKHTVKLHERKKPRG